MTIAWNTTCRASASSPCCRRVRRAKSDWEQRDRSLMWCDTENFRLNVTLSILISSTWVTPKTDNGTVAFPGSGGWQKLFPTTWKGLIRGCCYMPTFQCYWSLLNMTWRWLQEWSNKCHQRILIKGYQVWLNAGKRPWQRMRLALLRSPGWCWLLLCEAQTFNQHALCSGSGPRKMIQSKYIWGDEDRGMKTSRKQHCAAHCMYVCMYVRKFISGVP